MTAHSQWRGHDLEEINGVWVYADTKSPVSEDPRRACGRCGETPTSEDHDACLGTLPGVVNACCGHGQEDEAFVQLEGGTRFEGADASAILAAMTWENPHRPVDWSKVNSECIAHHDFGPDDSSVNMDLDSRYWYKLDYKRKGEPMGPSLFDTFLDQCVDDIQVCLVTVGINGILNEFENWLRGNKLLHPDVASRLNKICDDELIECESCGKKSKDVVIGDDITLCSKCIGESQEPDEPIKTETTG